MTIRARRAEQPETGRRRWAVLAVVSAAQFLIILDLWVVNIALPALQRDFAPATLPDVSWILDVYAIVLAALLLPAGRAADSIGRRECFLAGLVVFGVASLGCAVAPDLLALIACRALQAAGAAVLMPTSLGLALEVFPSHQRGTAVGVWAARRRGRRWQRAGAGRAAGRVELALDLPHQPARYPRRPGGRRGDLAAAPRCARTVQRPGRRIDGVGTVLVLGAVGLVCTALTEAPRWPPSRTWPVLAAGLVMGAVFVAHIRRHPDPLVAPAALFGARFPCRCGRARRLLHRLCGHALGYDAAADRAVALLGPAGRREHRARSDHGGDRLTVLGPAVGPLRSAGHGRGGRRAFRGGRGLAAGQRRGQPRLRGGRAAGHAAVGGGQRAHSAFAVRLR